mgnify:CR=1 FL=1
MRVQIRKVDSDTVREINGRLLPDEDGETTWREDGEYWAAYVDGRMAGFAGYVPSRRWVDAVYLHAAGVEDWANGHRIQARLIRARCRAAKKAGFAFAHTYTFPNNPASSRNLIRCGFKPYWPTSPWAGRQCYWVKTL